MARFFTLKLPANGMAYSPSWEKVILKEEGLSLSKALTMMMGLEQKNILQYAKNLLSSNLRASDKQKCK